MRPDDVAVIGMGCLFPQAGSLDEYWRNVVRAVDCITEVPATHWRPGDYYSEDRKAPDRTYARRGGFLSPYAFDPLAFGITPSAIEATDTSQLLGLVVAQAALEDAGYGLDRAFDRERVSCILGVTGALELVVPLGARLGHPVWKRALREAGVDDATADDVMARIGASYVGWQEASFPGLLGNVVAGRIANRLNLGGTNCVVDAACASSLSALHLAVMELRSGRCDMVVTGGVDTFSDIFMYMCFSKTPALSPTGDARPFAKDADGTMLGEGVGCVILKRLADARRDGDRVYAVVKSIGTSSDGKGQAIYAPSAGGQAKALRRAYAEAGFGPSTVELVEAHGTGTKVGDAVELTALAQVYREDRAEGVWCAVGSVKSQIGHTKAAAGVAGLIKATLALHERVLPPTLKVAEPAEALAGAPFYVTAAPRPWVRPPEHPRRAAVSAFGFGGSNFHCVLEEAEAGSGGRRAALRMDGDVQIVAYAGGDVGEVAGAVGADLARLQAPSGGGGERAHAERSAAGASTSWPLVRAVAAERRRSFSSAAPVRLCLVLRRGDDVLARLGQAADRLQSAADADTWQLPEGTWFDRRPPVPAVVGLFPGQGAQSPGMLSDFVMSSDTAMDFVSLAERLAAAARPGQRLSDLIYPRPSEASGALVRLTATDVAQPALGAVSGAALALLRQLGLPLGAAVGHSFGELTALHAAGVLSAEAFLRLALARGDAMAACGSGAMLAVQASREVVEALVARERLDVTVANHNAPAQVVLSGTAAGIQAAAAAFAAQGIPCRALQVAAAFHSPLVAPAGATFADALASEAFDAPQLPVVANATAAPYPADAAAQRSLLVQQVTSSVRFVDSLERLYQDGARVFVEIGPGRILTGLASATLKDRPDVTCVAVDGGAEPLLGLAKALATLASRGVPVALTLWDETFRPAPEAPAGRLLVPVCGANHRPPKKPSTRIPDMSQKSPEQQNPFLREAILALQAMQKQNADLHRQFLETQQHAQAQVIDLINRHLAGSVPALPAVQSSVAQPPAAASFAPPLAQPSFAPPPAPQTSFAPPQVGTPKLATPVPAPAPKAPIPAAPSFAAKPATPSAAPQPSFVTPPPVAAAPKPVAPAPRAPIPTAPGFAAKPATPAAAPTPVKTTLLTVVSEKTGYPADMLDLSMSLEGDLGIDSIKRVEIFSDLQARLPSARHAAADELTRLATLQEIVDFLSAAEALPPAAPPPAARQGAVAARPVAAPASVDSDAACAALLAVVAEKTGYPSDMLDLSMSLEGDLGIDSIKRVEIFSSLQERLPAARALGSEAMVSLQTLGDIVSALSAPSAAPAPGGAATLGKSEAPAPSDGVGAVGTADAAEEGIERLVLALRSLPPPEPPLLRPDDGDGELWIAGVAGDDLAASLTTALHARGFRARFVDLAPPESVPPTLRGLVLVAPLRDVTSVPPRDVALAAFSLAKAAAPALAAHASIATPLFATVTRTGGAFGLGGVVRFATALDAGLAGLAKTASHEWPDVRCRSLDVADDLWNAAGVIATELLADGPLEVGLADAGRFGLELTATPLARSERRAAPLAPGELLVVTGGARGVTAAVAEALARAWRPTLLVLGRSPAPAPEAPWLAAAVTPAEVKAALLAHASPRPTPRELQAACDAVMGAREVRASLAAFAASGARALYEAVDVRDEAAVRALLARAQEAYGPVRGLVHGAGVLADKLIVDKTPEAFARVYETKVLGLSALMAALAPEELRFLGLFSSSTGRFGRRGQADYAVANEALNKAAQHFAHALPACRVLSFNWGPWDGGMVTPSLKQLFRQEGLDVIGLEAGASYLVAEAELACAGSPRELVILGRAPHTNARKSESPAVDAAPVAAAELEDVLTLTVDAASYPVLAAHVLGGRAVVPAALMLEWMALAALQRHPGLRLTACDDFRVLRGVMLAAGEATTLRLLVGPLQRTDDGDYTVPVEIRGAERPRARGTVRLAAGVAAVDPESPRLDRPRGAYSRDLGEAYEQELFHGALLRGITGVLGSDERGIAAEVATHVGPAAFLPSPLRQAWVTQPLALDCCFQLAVLWSVQHVGAPCLPSAVRRYAQLRAFPHDGVEARLAVVSVTPGRLVADVELVDRAGRLVARLEGFEATVDPALRRAFAKRRLDGAQAV